MSDEKSRPSTQQVSLFQAASPSAPDEPTALDWGGIAQVDIVQALQGDNRGGAVRMMRLEQLLRYNEEHPEIDGVRVTVTSLYVLAAALALKDCPRAAYHLKGYREMRPRSLDIGLSVAGLLPDAPMAPTVVVQDVANKELRQVSQELREKAKLAREQQVENLRQIGRLVSFLPIGFLRRAIIRLVARAYDSLRREVGVFQISNVHGSGIEIPFSSVVPHTLLLMGEIKPYPVVNDGEVCVERGSWAVLQYDHALMTGGHAGEWLHAFQQHLANPEKLYHSLQDDSSRSSEPE
jgi:pyruvate/2-oxoglutarate dehydrogenase complex dihydrolipoamide acyltransferase (E2) component